MDRKTWLEKEPGDKLPKSEKKGKRKKRSRQKKVYYNKHNWHGVLEVFKCTECGHFENFEDAMKLHVLRHVPEGDRAKLLDELMR